MPVVLMQGIALINLVITAAGRDSFQNIGSILIVLVKVHNFSGYGIGYLSSKLFGLNVRDVRTVAIEMGMQNTGLTTCLVKAMGKIATVDLAPAVF